MNKRMQEIERKLLGNVLADKCTHCDSIIFQSAWASQERVLRFTTPLFRLLLPPKGVGKWKTGDHVMYEVCNDSDRLAVCCVLSGKSLPRDLVVAGKKILSCCGMTPSGNAEYILNDWTLSEASDLNQRMAAFDVFLGVTLPDFEKQLSKLMAEAQPVELKEGERIQATADKFERNPKARQACIAAHGTTCAICGFDFGRVYGQKFAGIIEVHHIVPLHQIGKEYIVDPVKDLIPVCSNCHTALHSKQGGVYSVEELKKIFQCSEKQWIE